MPTRSEVAGQVVRAASDRVGADLLRTTGRNLTLDLRDGSVALVNIILDGEARGGFAVLLIEDVERSIAEIVDALCEHTLHEEVWGGWPMCARHSGHPLDPSVSDGRAVWKCPQDHVVVAAIGELGSIGR